MSDVSHGPGWWQASDGKWYPPQPAAPPPPGPPPPGPAPQWGGPPPAKRSNKGCLIALAVVGVVALLGIAAVVAVVLVVEDEVDDRVDDGITTFSDNDENPPADDVTIAECGPAPQTGFMSASVDVLNHSSAASNYLVTVAFESEDGGTQFTTATTGVDGLGPDQTTTVEANAFQEPPSGQEFSCRVSQVERFAA